MHFGSFIFKNLLRRKFRSLLTALGVAVAIAAVVALMGLSSGLRRSSIERFESRGVDLVVLRAGVAQHLNSSLNQAIGERLAKLKNVGKIAPSLTDMVAFGGSSLIGVPLNGWPHDSPAFSNLKITSGKTFDGTATHEVILGKMLAANLKKNVGDRLDIEGSDFKVIGVYESANMFDNGAAVVPLADLQDLMDRQNQVTEFQVGLAGEAKGQKEPLDKLRAEIEGLKDADGKLLGLAALPTEQFINNNTEIRLIDAMAWITSAIALAIGSVGMLNTMVMSVLERTQEIGILRAIGWRKKRIVQMILCESFLLSLVGAVAGVLLAMLMTRTLASFSPVQAYVRSDLSPAVIGIGFALAGLVSLAGGAYPAIRGANLPPTEALRYE